MPEPPYPACPAHSHLSPKHPGLSTQELPLPPGALCLLPKCSLPSICPAHPFPGALPCQSRKSILHEGTHRKSLPRCMAMTRPSKDPKACVSPSVLQPFPTGGLSQAPLSSPPSKGEAAGCTQTPLLLYSASVEFGKTWPSGQMQPEG